MSSFDIRVFAIRRRSGRAAFEVRWRVAGRVPRRPRLRRRARTAARQPPRPGALARTRSCDGCQPGYGRQPGAGPGDPAPCRPRTARAGRVLRLPVLRGAAPGGGRRAAPRGSHPPGERPREDHPHRRLPAYRYRMDQHRDAARAARPQAPPRRHHPRHPHPARPGPHAPPPPAPVRHHTRRTAVPRHRGGILSESVYGRAWHAARLAALGPELAATPLARRPYDLRHAALSLWLNATGEPAEVAARAGNSARVLHEVYLHCIDSEDDVVSQQIEDALNAGTGSSRPPECVKASGCAHRRLPRDPVRYVSVNLRHRPTSGPRTPARARQDRGRPVFRRPTVSTAHTVSFGSTIDVWRRPGLAHA